MLSQKLVHKYGVTCVRGRARKKKPPRAKRVPSARARRRPGSRVALSRSRFFPLRRTRGAPVNKKIVNVVTEFMGTHSRITEGDLVVLEESVSKAIGKPLGQSASMPSMPAIAAAPAAAKPPIFATAGPTSSRPATTSAGATRPAPAAMPAANEWTLLDTFNAIENEELSKKSYATIRQRQTEFKAELDAQVFRNSFKSGEDKAADQKYLSEQARMLQEWKKTQQEKTAAITNRNQEEKKVREQQIAARKAAREAERNERQTREEKELALCRREIQRQQQNALNKKEAERERLKNVRIENAKENAIRATRAAEEAAEDQRLMNEYKAKLDKEESDRASAFARRMARLEQFSQKSGTEEGGAIYQQQKAEREFEELVLKEALKKDQADEDRERRDKENLRLNKIRMAHENKMLMMAKKQAKDAANTDEANYANRFRREGEEYLREEHDRFVSNREKAIEHQAELSAQIEATRASQAKIDMSERERAMNRQMLLKLAGDEEMMKKIQTRLSVNAGAGKTVRENPIGFGSGGDDDEDL